MPHLKETIDDVVVEINIETGALQFKFRDEDEGCDEVLIITDSAKLLNFLNTYYNRVRPQFVRKGLLPK